VRTQRRQLALLIACGAFLLGACSPQPRQDPFGNDAPRRERITGMTYKADCAGLHAEFQKAVTDRDDDLMIYIDEHADEAGCFPEGAPHFMEA